jgi:3'-phosphoadenosine 5'-phosphosulfate sulfotransferase (PAPS reductase)/FAD synthetase
MVDAEQTVDEMLAEGRRVMAEAIAAVRPQYIIAAYSGGNDSIVSTHFAREQYPDCIVFNADTMIGLKPARDHIARVCQSQKWDAEIIQARSLSRPPEYPKSEWIEGATAYETKTLNYGFGGPPFHKYFYTVLKERPLMELRRRIITRGRRILVVSGIRHDESSIRAGYKRAWKDVPKQGTAWVNPFYWRSATDFELYRQEFGLPRNPVKARCGISGECCCGSFGSPDERLAYQELDAVFHAYLDELEGRVMERFPWKWGHGPPEWWKAAKYGQMFLFQDSHAPPEFQPMCVGCLSGRR